MSPHATTFPVEQVRELTELDLPACSAPQAMALVDIREAGGSYHYFGKKLGWLPPGGDCLSKAARAHFRHTDRTVISLVRSSYLTVEQERDGHPVKVRLTFP